MQLFTDKVLQRSTRRRPVTSPKSPPPWPNGWSYCSAWPKHRSARTGCGHWLPTPSPPHAERKEPDAHLPSVLFVCVKNGSKSQMAAGLMRDCTHRVEQQPVTQVLLQAHRRALVVRAQVRVRSWIPGRVHQEVSDSRSSRALAAVGTRPDRTTFSSTTSPGVDMTP